MSDILPDLIGSIPISMMKANGIGGMFSLQSDFECYFSSVSSSIEITDLDMLTI